MASVKAQARARARAERTRTDFGEDCREALQLLTDLRTSGPGLIDRAAIPVDDGFGSGHSAEDGGRSSGGTRDLSDVLVRREYLAEHGIDPDPVGTAVSQMLAHVKAALAALRRASDAAGAAVRIPAAEVGETPEVPGCVNCARFDVRSPVHRRVDGLPSGCRCRACYDYRRRHDGRDAPEALVLARPEVSGKRQMVRAA